MEPLELNASCLAGESFSALAEGLAGSPRTTGGVPAEHKTDSLRAAWKQQAKDGGRELTERYAALCQHYGCRAYTIMPVGATKMARLKVPQTSKKAYLSGTDTAGQ